MACRGSGVRVSLAPFGSRPSLPAAWIPWLNRQWEGAPGGGAFAPVASDHPGIWGVLVQVSGFQRSACLEPGREGIGHGAGERCSGLDLLSCDRCPGYAAREVNEGDTKWHMALAYGMACSPRHRVFFDVNGTSCVGTGSGVPGRIVLEGMAGLAPMSPLKFNLGFRARYGVPREFLFPYSDVPFRIHPTSGAPTGREAHRAPLRCRLPAPSLAAGDRSESQAAAHGGRPAPLGRRADPDPRGGSAPPADGASPRLCFGEVGHPMGASTSCP